MSEKKFRLWALGRRIQYGLGFLVFCSLIGTLVFYTNFYQPPNCFDRLMNGDETGVDCGGACVRVCAAETVPPSVVWAESFEINEGQYNAVAYIENQEVTIGAPALDYTFQLLNRGVIVAERSGTTVLPPNGVYPIFEGKILVGEDEIVTDTKLALDTAELWLPATINSKQFRTVDINLTGEDTNPRLDAKIENTELTKAEDVEVIATIFSEDGIPLNASRTEIDFINPRSNKDIVFTWPNSIAKTVRVCAIPTDVVVGIDLSGSMNNDGENPPQPVTDALQAASNFVNALGVRDQVSVVTFATEADIVTELTNLHESVAESILNLSIDPEEEAGFTNTVDALRGAQAELNSGRHNTSARRALVLLTDGLPTASGEEDAVALTEEAADTLRSNNIEVYAIGLGESVDKEFISGIATTEEKSYFAPSGADLEKIYAEITSSLCEVGATKIEVIGKAKTNFAPLQ